MKKLKRSSENRMIFGVLGGVGEYFSIDATILRLATVIFAVVTMVLPVVLVYLAAAFIMPEGERRDDLR